MGYGKKITVEGTLMKKKQCWGHGHGEVQ